jgi:hypothetical protein
MKQNIYQQRILQWKKQHGNLSLHAQKKLKNLLEEFEKSQAISKTSKELRLAIRTKLIREYQGKTITVTVMTNGFEFKNKVYKSLSAIANEVTGKHWNGRKFFGVV